MSITPRDELYITELQELLDMASPEDWKHTIESLYFTLLIEHGYDAIPKPDETTRRVYALITFFNEIRE